MKTPNIKLTMVSFTFKNGDTRTAFLDLPCDPKTGKPRLSPDEYENIRGELGVVPGTCIKFG